MHIKDLTTDELKALIRETVQAALEDLLPDPDLGLTVKPEFEQTLQAIRQRRATAATGMTKLSQTNRQRIVNKIDWFASHFEPITP